MGAETKQRAGTASQRWREKSASKKVQVWSWECGSWECSQGTTKVVPVILSGFPQFFFFKFFCLLITSISQSQLRKTCSCHMWLLHSCAPSFLMAGPSAPGGHSASIPPPDANSPLSYSLTQGLALSYPALLCQVLLTKTRDLLRFLDRSLRCCHQVQAF